MVGKRYGAVSPSTSPSTSTSTTSGSEEHNGAVVVEDMIATFTAAAIDDIKNNIDNNYNYTNTSATSSYATTTTLLPLLQLKILLPILILRLLLWGNGSDHNSFRVDVFESGI